MRKETLSVPVLAIRLVPGKTFGFARLADRGGDAFVSPPLMRKVEGAVPPHAIVEMAERGRRVVRFLEKPETKLVWEGIPDEERMMALAPEIARRWVDWKKANPAGIVSVSDYGHEEFSSLWSAAVSAGEADKFLVRLDKEIMAAARQAEIASRFGQLFTEWQATLADSVRASREKLLKAASSGYDYRPEMETIHHTPWWFAYVVGADQRNRVLAVALPLSDETDLIVSEVLSAKKAESDAARAKADAEEEQRWRAIVARAGLSNLVLRPRLVESGNWHPLVVALRDQTFSVSGPSCHQVRNFADWLAGLGYRREALRVSGKNWTRFDPYSEQEIEEIIASEDERARWFELFAAAEKAGLVQKSGCNFSWAVDCRCSVGGAKVSDSFFKSHSNTEGLWPNEREKFLAWGGTEEAVSWERMETPAATSAELSRLIGIADMEAVKRDPHRHEPITETATAEKARLITESIRLKEAAKVEELRRCGLREEEARRAAADKAEERRLLSIVTVRKNWRAMLRWVQASGGYRALHPDAQALLERIRSAQDRAAELRRANQPRRAVAEVKRKESEKSGFLSKGAWGALDDLKL